MSTLSRLLPKPTQLIKVGKVASAVGEKSFVYSGLAVTALCLICWIATIDSDKPDGVIAFMVTTVATALVIFSHVLGEVLLRSRTINDYTYSPERYALISDELRSRGIFHTRSYIADHPEHLFYSNELTRELGWSENPDCLTAADQFESLIYTEDTDPARTKDLIKHIVIDRGITDHNEARVLLATMLHTKEAISSGAL